LKPDGWDEQQDGRWPDDGVFIIRMRLPSANRSIKSRANDKRPVLLIASQPMEHLGLTGVLRHIIGWKCSSGRGIPDICSRLCGSGAHVLAMVYILMCPWFHKHVLKKIPLGDPSNPRGLQPLNIFPTVFAKDIVDETMDKTGTNDSDDNDDEEDDFYQSSDEDTRDSDSSETSDSDSSDDDSDNSDHQPSFDQTFPEDDFEMLEPQVILNEKNSMVDLDTTNEAWKTVLSVPDDSSFHTMDNTLDTYQWDVDEEMTEPTFLNSPIVSTADGEHYLTFYVRHFSNKTFNYTFRPSI
jgi:hypothetical protein